MANIVVQQDPLAEAISSIPDLIFKARQLKSQENQQNLQNQISLDTLELKKSQMEFDRARIERQEGTSAGGYENNDIGEYFNNLSMTSGTLESDAGTLVWNDGPNPGGNIPSANEALAKYKQIIANSGKSYNADSDMQLFGQYYNGMIQTRHGKYKAQIGKMIGAGFDAEDVADAIAADPQWEANINAIINNDYSGEMGKFYGKYLPTKSSTGIVGDMTIPKAAIGGTALYTGGQLLYDWGQATPDDIIQAAKKKFWEMRAADKEAWEVAKSKVDKARTAKTKQKYQEISRKAWAKYAETNKKGAKELKKVIREGKNWKTMSKGMWGKTLRGLGNFSGFAPMLLGHGAGGIAGFVGGEKTGALTQGVVGGTAAAGQVTARTLSLARSTSLGQFVAKQIVKQTPLMAKTFGISAMADSPASPIGDILGLAMAGYIGFDTVKDAIETWNRANSINREE